MDEVRKAGLREKAVAEARAFFVVFIYVWFLLAVFGLHKWLILSDANIVSHQSIAVLKALAFAKIMFVAEKMRIGERFAEKPLIWPVLFKSAIFAALLIVMDMAEQAIIHRFWPGAGANSGDVELGDLQTTLIAGVVIFAALIPFFALRELSRVLGETQLYELFFVRRRFFISAPETTNPQAPKDLDETDE